MLSINNLKFSYGNELVLDQLNLDLEAGCVHGLLGLNGSGKTTLLDILAGKLKPQSGTIQYNHKQLSYRQLAYLEWEMRFYPLLTAREFLKIYQLGNHNFDIDRWNELFELPLDYLIETYSAGMKKKLGFMAVLCQDKPVILLDEPFNNLDIDTNRLIAKLLNVMAEKGKFILLTSHILEILTAMTDYICVMEEGCIQETSLKKTLKAGSIRIGHRKRMNCSIRLVICFEYSRRQAKIAVGRCGISEPFLVSKINL